MAFDAVLVGAGHNALAAAIHLASKGWSVGVFEQSDKAGGAVRTEEVTLPGFRHDLYAMNLSLFAGSPFMAEHGAALAEHGLAFVPAEHCFASPMRDGRWFGVSKDLETTVGAGGAILRSGRGDVARDGRGLSAAMRRSSSRCSARR